LRWIRRGRTKQAEQIIDLALHPPFVGFVDSVDAAPERSPMSGTI
jgi:hypothetical protein